MLSKLIQSPQLHFPHSLGDSEVCGVLTRSEPVTRGARLGAFFWVQSMVREDGRRDILFALDNALQKLGRDMPDHPSLVEIAGAYHNLLRLWSDT